MFVMPRQKCYRKVRDDHIEGVIPCLKEGLGSAKLEYMRGMCVDGNFRPEK